MTRCVICSREYVPDEECDPGICSQHCLDILEQKMEDDPEPVWALCVACKKVKVEIGQGFDTCFFCLKKQ